MTIPCAIDAAFPIIFPKSGLGFVASPTIVSASLLISATSLMHAARFFYKLLKRVAFLQSFAAFFPREIMLFTVPAAAGKFLLVS